MKRIFVLFVLTTVLLPSMVLAHVQAITPAQNGVFLKGVYYYDVSTNSCESTQKTNSPQDPNNAAKIWNFFAGKNLDAVAIAGIMGNFEQESTPYFDPAIKQNGSVAAIPDGGDGLTGFGIAQWTSQSRQASLFKKIKEAKLEKYYGAGWGHPEVNRDIPQTDIDRLLLVELNFAWESDAPVSIKDIAKELNTANTVEGDAGSTVLFHRLFEKSNDSAQQIRKRVVSAKSFMEQFGANANGCAGSLGGVNKLEDTLPWAMRFINDTKNKYKDAAPAVASVVSSPSVGGNSMKIATFPESTSFVCWGAYGCDECVTLTGWFVTNMTEYTYGMGNGGEVVSNLAAKGVPTGKAPRPFSIFSYASSSGYGHTGLVLGVFDNGDVITLENNSPSNTLTAYRRDIVAQHPDVRFAYVDDKLKVDVSSNEP